MEVRWIDLRQVASWQLACWEDWLTGEERQRLEAMSGSRRQTFLCGRGLAREMVGEALGIPPETVRFSLNSMGKPETDGIFFSISHSGYLVGCAVDRVPIGLDVQQTTKVPPRRLSRWMGEGEAFFHHWARREALAKCRGESVLQWLHREEPETGYRWEQLPVPQGYCAWVCRAEE